MRWYAALVACLLLAPALARAQEQAYVHVVRADETLASIAQAYYGDVRRKAVLVTENALGDLEALPDGMRLVIPVVRYHRVTAGDSWRSLAERYYGDPSRAATLLKANHARSGTTPEQGAQVLVPYPLRHTVRSSSETYASIAALYYDSRDEARALRAFNGGRAKLTRGQVVLVPLSDLVLSRQGLVRVESSAGVRPDTDELGRAQAEIARDIPRLHGYVQSGRYVEAAALGNQLLGRGQLTGNQEVSIQRELATSYVALDRHDLAVTAFARALEKQPDLELDSVRTSPRVLAALEAAKRQRQR